MSKIPIFPNKFAILASILGAYRTQLSTGTDLNNVVKEGAYYYYGSNNILNAPCQAGILIVKNSEKSDGWMRQEIYDAANGTVYYRYKTGSINYSQWEQISVNVPSFYKNYSDLSSLASALSQNMGIRRNVVEIPANGGTYNLDVQSKFVCIFADTDYFNGVLLLISGSGNTFYYVNEAFRDVFNEFINISMNNSTYTITNISNYNLRFPLISIY